jgi:hypothetical protein
MQHLTNNFIPDLTPDLIQFKSVNLQEINQAKLMNRVDHKFVMSKNDLFDLLPALYKNYYVLKIENVFNHQYTSTYFDTHDLAMYHAHHNQRANRFKIRQRFYHTTDDAFMEIKRKDNKGVTHKSRTEVDHVIDKIPYRQFDFVIGNSTFHPMALEPVMTNEFYRFTLVNKSFTQRVTVDTGLQFFQNENSVSLPDLVITEVKSLRNNMDTTIFNLLYNRHIKPTGMSKYAIGMALLNPTLKQNLFKQKINKLKTITHVA